MSIFTFLKLLQTNIFSWIPCNSNNFKYIDDILLIYRQELNLIKITDRLNNIEPTMKFPHELEANNFLLFLDVLLIRNNDKVESKINRKHTCKNDHGHFYFHHNTNTKWGITKGFYLKVLYICSPKYFDEEFNYIENSFLNFLYSKHFKQYAKSKAFKVHKRKRSQTSINTPSNIIKHS